MMQALRTPETDPTKPISAGLNLSKLLSVKRRVAYQPASGKFYYTTQEIERK